MHQASVVGAVGVVGVVAEGRRCSGCNFWHVRTYLESWMLGQELSPKSPA
jgi:hypothetical protein